MIVFDVVGFRYYLHLLLCPSPNPLGVLFESPCGRFVIVSKKVSAERVENWKSRMLSRGKKAALGLDLVRLLLS